MQRRGMRGRAGWAWLSLAVLVLVAAVLGWLLVRPGSADPVDTPAPSAATPTSSPTASPTPTSRPTPTATPSPAPAGMEDGRLTLLVLGSDGSAQRRAEGRSWLTDVITVVSVSADGSHVLMASLPRDTTDLAMPDGSTWTGKVNAIAPILGPDVLADVIGLLLSLDVDYHVMVDMDGFRQIAEAVGGVPVTATHTLTDAACTIGPGSHLLDASLALCFARHRATDDDYARAARHQQLLLGIRDQALAGGVDPMALIASVESLETDVPMGEIPLLVELAALSADAEVDRLVLGPPEFTTFVGIAGARGWISIPNVPVIQETVATLLDR